MATGAAGRKQATVFEEALFNTLAMYTHILSRENKGTERDMPVQALGYVKFGKVIFRRPFGTEVCFPDVRVKATSIWCLKTIQNFACNGGPSGVTFCR